MNCLERPKANEHHNVGCEAMREGLTSSWMKDNGQPAAKPAPKGEEGSETRVTALVDLLRAKPHERGTSGSPDDDMVRTVEGNPTEGRIKSLPVTHCPDHSCSLRQPGCKRPGNRLPAGCASRTGVLLRCTLWL